MTEDSVKAAKWNFDTYEEAARQYVTSKNTIESHTEKKDAARDYILVIHKEKGEQKLEEAGFESTASRIVKETVSPEKLKENHPDIYDKCEYVTITMKKAVYANTIKADVEQLVIDGRAKMLIGFNEKALKVLIDNDLVKVEEIEDSITRTESWRLLVKNGKK